MMANSTNIVEILKESFDAENVSFAEAAKEAGYLDVADELETVALDVGRYSAFVELHIEQGPILEKKGKF